MSAILARPQCFKLLLHICLHLESNFSVRDLNSMMVWQHTSLVTGGSIKTYNAELWCFPCWASAVELTMTWDTMTLMWRHCNVINSSHSHVCIAARNCGHHRYFKIYMKWGQRNFSTNVYNKRPFSTCFRLLNTCSTKGILNRLSWLLLAGLYVIGALFHMLPPDAHWPANLLYPGTG